MDICSPEDQVQSHSALRVQLLLETPGSGFTHKHNKTEPERKRDTHRVRGRYDQTGQMENTLHCTPYCSWAGCQFNSSILCVLFSSSEHDRARGHFLFLTIWSIKASHLAAIKWEGGNTNTVWTRGLQLTPIIEEQEHHRWRWSFAACITSYKNKLNCAFYKIIIEPIYIVIIFILFAAKILAGINFSPLLSCC